MEEVVQKLAKQIEGLAFSAKVPTQEDWGLWDRQLQWIEKKIYQEVSVFRKDSFENIWFVFCSRVNKGMDKEWDSRQRLPSLNVCKI